MMQNSMLETNYGKEIQCHYASHYALNLANFGIGINVTRRPKQAKTVMVFSLLYILQQAPSEDRVSLTAEDEAGYEMRTPHTL